MRTWAIDCTIATGQDRNVSLAWRKSPFDISCLSPLVSPFDILCLLLTYCVSFWHIVSPFDILCLLLTYCVSFWHIVSPFGITCVPQTRQLERAKQWWSWKMYLVKCKHSSCGVNNPSHSSSHLVYICVYMYVCISLQYVVSTVHCHHLCIRSSSVYTYAFVFMHIHTNMWCQQSIVVHPRIWATYVHARIL